jgi:hypothetical protein
MGLLKLLAFPVSGPFWVAKVVHEQAQRQMYDTDDIRRQIADLEVERRSGRIDQQTFEDREEMLLQRLIDAREYHRRSAEST